MYQNQTSRTMNFLSPMILPLGIILLSNFTLTTQNSPNEIQYVEFHGGDDCVDLWRRVNDTDWTPRPKPGFTNAETLRVNGLWRIMENTTDLDRWHWTTGIFINSCVYHDFYPDNLRFSSVQRFGPLNQSESSISFYTERYFNSDQHLDGDSFSSGGNKSLALPNSVNISSWHLNGVEDWGVYPNTDFTGPETCLKAGIDATVVKHGVSWSLQYKTDSEFLVGSAKIGCSSGSVGIVPMFGFLLIAVFVMLCNSLVGV